MTGIIYIDCVILDTDDAYLDFLENEMQLTVLSEKAMSVILQPMLCSQVIVMVLSDEKSDHMIDVATVDLLQDREGFTWKGHDRLPPKSGSVVFAPGFQPVVLVQCMPPAAVTAVTLHAEWNLIAFGTSHGFGLFDYHRRSPVLAR